MPNFLQSAQNMFFAPANWLSRVTGPPQPTGLFQTRITRTPGGFAPQPEGVLGQFAGKADPRQLALNAQELDPDDRQKLAALWGQLGRGVITMPPGQIDPTTMRHEQIHALNQSAGLEAYAPQIAGLIDPGLVDQIKADPVYQKEIQAFGEAPTIANEGAAFQIAQMPYAKSTPALQDEIMRHLKTSIQQKQFQKLTSRPGQSQK